MADKLTALVATLASELLARDQCLAVAESCTGGWVAKVCTDMAGSSAWFERGFVTYSNAAKQEALGVSAATLEAHGAVSEQTVLEMVGGVIRNSRAQWGLAVSGIAGPGGGSPRKPVGTVWIAWAGPGNWRAAREYRFYGDRDTVRGQAVAASLGGLLERLRSA